MASISERKPEFRYARFAFVRAFFYLVAIIIWRFLGIASQSTVFEIDTPDGLDTK
jgi:hypothetical protein